MPDIFVIVPTDTAVDIAHHQKDANLNLALGNALERIYRKQGKKTYPRNGMACLKPSADPSTKQTRGGKKYGSASFGKKYSNTYMGISMVGKLLFLIYCAMAHS